MRGRLWDWIVRLAGVGVVFRITWSFWSCAPLALDEATVVLGWASVLGVVLF